jgi:hypothetical protein
MESSLSEFKRNVAVLKTTKILNAIEYLPEMAPADIYARLESSQCFNQHFFPKDRVTMITELVDERTSRVSQSAFLVRIDSPFLIN